MKIKRFTGGLLESNCYIVTSSYPCKTQTCYIIDPGYESKKIIDHILTGDLVPEGIILTHHHHDHCGGAPRIRKELDCPVMIHTMDADRYPDAVDRYLEAGDIIELAPEDELTVLHTPGHTEGSICLMSDANKVCFTGDTIFNVDLGRTDLDDGDPQDMRNSIINIVDKWSNDVTIYPGHGDPATMKTVRRINKEFLEMINDYQTYSLRP